MRLTTDGLCDFEQPQDVVQRFNGAAAETDADDDFLIRFRRDVDGKDDAETAGFEVELRLLERRWLNVVKMGTVEISRMLMLRTSVTTTFDRSVSWMVWL